MNETERGEQINDAPDRERSGRSPEARAEGRHQSHPLDAAASSSYSIKREG